MAAVLFLAVSLGRPLHTVRALGDALDVPSTRNWLLFTDSLLRTLVLIAFAVFIYRRRPSRGAERSLAAFVACAAAIVPLMVLVNPAPGAPLEGVVGGELLVIAAVAFTLASVLSLGTCFGVLPEVRGLVTRGPYRLVRHPVYLGEIIAVVGFVIASAEPLNLVPVAVFCAGQAVRLRMEESALLAAFPAEYGAYRTHTPALVPRVRTTVRRWPRRTDDVASTV